MVTHTHTHTHTHSHTDRLTNRLCNSRAGPGQSIENYPSLSRISWLHREGPAGVDPFNQNSLSNPPLPPHSTFLYLRYKLWHSARLYGPRVESDKWYNISRLVHLCVCVCVCVWVCLFECVCVWCTCACHIGFKILSLQQLISTHFSQPTSIQMLHSIVLKTRNLSRQRPQFHLLENYHLEPGMVADKETHTHND